MTSKEIKARIAAIDARLDDPNISDEEYDALEAEARRLIQDDLREAERRERIASMKHLTRATPWLESFLSSFSCGTRLITNKQAECFKRVGNCRPFVWDGRIYDCPGPNDRAGFSHLVVENI